MGFVAPLGELVQFAGESVALSCKTKPGVLGVQEIVAWPEAAGTIVSVGAPVTEYWPLVMEVLASGWPMVPLREYCPFVLVPPPPAILDQSMEY